MSKTANGYIWTNLAIFPAWTRPLEWVVLPLVSYRWYCGIVTRESNTLPLTSPPLQPKAPIHNPIGLLYSYPFQGCVAISLLEPESRWCFYERAWYMNERFSLSFLGEPGNGSPCSCTSCSDVSNTLYMHRLFFDSENLGHRNPVLVSFAACKDIANNSSFTLDLISFEGCYGFST